MGKENLIYTLSNNILSKGVSQIKLNLLKYNKISEPYIGTSKKDAIDLMLSLKPIINQLIDNNFDSSNNLLIIKKVHSQFKSLNSDISPISTNDEIFSKCKKATFLEYCLLISCKFILNESIALNIPTVSVYMSLIIEELSINSLLKSKEKVFPYMGYFKSSKFVRGLLDDFVILGEFSKPFSVESYLISIYDGVYKRLFDDFKVKSTLKSKKINDENIKKLNCLFFILLYGIFIDDINSSNIRFSSFIERLYNE